MSAGDVRTSRIEPTSSKEVFLLNHGAKITNLFRRMDRVYLT
jgi:hypothetical protein